LRGYFGGDVTMMIVESPVMRSFAESTASTSFKILD
jgi:hypothetical protein